MYQEPHWSCCSQGAGIRVRYGHVTTQRDRFDGTFFCPTSLHTAPRTIFTLGGAAGFSPKSVVIWTGLSTALPKRHWGRAVRIGERVMRESNFTHNGKILVSQLITQAHP